MFSSSNAFTENYDSSNFEEPEARVAARRMQVYSQAALRVALPIDHLFVGHPAFASGLRMLDRLFQLAPEVTVSHGAILVGPTGSGKSSLIRDFRERLPRSSLFVAGYGAVAARANSRPTAGYLVSAMLQAYRHPFPAVTTRTIYIRRQIVFDTIRENGTRLVFVDEADRLLQQVRRRGDSVQQPEATQFLRDMMDECRVAVVLAGTNSLDQLASVDNHLADRLSVRHELRHFEADKDWLGVLRSFAKQSVLFNIDVITDKIEAKRLHLATQGSLRRLKRLITEGALIAAQEGKAALDASCLARAFTLVEGQDALRTSPYA